MNDGWGWLMRMRLMKNGAAADDDSIAVDSSSTIQKSYFSWKPIWLRSYMRYPGPEHSCVDGWGAPNAWTHTDLLGRVRRWTVSSFWRGKVNVSADFRGHCFALVCPWGKMSARDWRTLWTPRIYRSILRWLAHPNRCCSDRLLTNIISINFQHYDHH